MRAALDDLPLDVTKRFDEVVALLRRRRFSEAADVITKNWTGRSWPCYHPLGDLFLDQKGTLVSGEYRFENGQNGNVQGTLVNGQLVLERIDAQYGRIGRLEAALSKDQNSLKGTWYSYEVSSGQPLMGAVAIDRVPPPEESAP